MMQVLKCVFFSFELVFLLICLLYVVLNISMYFETKQKYVLAGKYLLLCGEYTRALQMFFQAPPNDEKAIEMAIETVGLANNNALTHGLIDYLMGERDGVPKVI